MNAFLKENFGPGCDLVQQLLLYDRELNPIGLLPMQLAQIASHKIDVQLLLVALCDRLHKDRPSADQLAEVRRLLLEVVCRLDWFSYNTTPAIKTIFNHCRQGVNPDTLRNGISSSLGNQTLPAIPHPDECASAIRHRENLAHGMYYWVEMAEEHTGLVGDQPRARAWYEFLDFRLNYNLLFYAQRHFLAEKFPAYELTDSCERETNRETNYIWQMEPLVMPMTMSAEGRREEALQYVANEWLETIGNLRAWPMENGLPSVTPAADRITTVDQMTQSFITPTELCMFTRCDDILENEQCANRFATICGDRLVRIYREWWDAVVKW